MTLLMKGFSKAGSVHIDKFLKADVNCAQIINPPWPSETVYTATGSVCWNLAEQINVFMEAVLQEIFRHLRTCSTICIY